MIPTWNQVTGLFNIQTTGMFVCFYVHVCFFLKERKRKMEKHKKKVKEKQK